MRRALGVLLAVTAFVAALPPAASAQAPVDPRLEPIRTQVAEAVAAQIPGSRIKKTDDGRVDPLFNVPGAADLAIGRTHVLKDPDFWVASVRNLLVSGAIVPPSPIDWVKPELFLPTAPIANGSYVSALPREQRDLSGVTYEWQGEQKTIKQFMRTTETDIVAFVRDGRVVADWYENGWNPETRHQPWSVTKSFISAVVGIALAEGKVRSVDDPIDLYISELKGTAWEGARIQDILQMESGVHWDEDTPVLAVNTQVQQWIQAGLDFVTDGQLGQGRNEFLKSLPKFAEPGTKWKYNSGNTQVLAWLTETVYGKPFNEVISEKLWQPAGMAGDARILTDRVGDAIASQGLYSRVFDLARFGELFRKGGRTPEGHQVVPEAWTRESTQMTDVSEGRYAYQWWHGPTPQSYQASGFQGQKISVSPDHCLTGVRLSHAFGVDSRPDDGPATDPAAYSFGTEFHANEWNAMYSAVARHLGTCERSAVAGAKARRPRLTGPSRMSRRAALRRGALRMRLAGTGGRSRVVIVARNARGRAIATRRLASAPSTARWVHVPLTDAGEAWLRARRTARLSVIVSTGQRTAPAVKRRIVLS
jgi:CubicO group peptidase (beta-lactamase class C family)